MNTIIWSAAQQQAKRIKRCTNRHQRSREIVILCILLKQALGSK